MRNTSAMAGSAESWGYGGDMYVPTNRVLEGVAGIGDSDKSLSHLRFFFLCFVLDITQKPLFVECQSVAAIEGTALNTDFSLFLAN